MLNIIGVRYVALARIDVLTQTDRKEGREGEAKKRLEEVSYKRIRYRR